MDTATKAIEHVPFKERIAKLGLKELREVANVEFGLVVDEKLKIEVVKDQLLRIYEQNTSDAKTLNEQSAMLFEGVGANGKVVPVKFLPQDFPNAPVNFSNDCGFGIRDPKNPKRNPTGLSKVPVFKLIPGEVYNLPICVIRMLEGKTFRDSKPTYDLETGMINGNRPVIKPRFMLPVVLSDDAMREMGTNL